MDSRMEELAARARAGELGPGEAEELAALLARHPDGAAEYEHDGRFDLLLRAALAGPALRERIERGAAARLSAPGPVILAARRSLRRRGLLRAAIFLASSAAAVFVAVRGILHSFPPGPPPEARPAVVLLSGEVWAAAGRFLAAGTRLDPGTGIRTGPGASLGLAFPDGTQVEAGEGAEFLLEEAAPAKRLRLSGGLLKVAVPPQPPGRPFVIETPAARAEVLGTRLAVSVFGASTRLEVEEGRVRLAARGEGGAVEVSAGFQAVAAPGLGLEVLPAASQAPPAAANLREPNPVRPLFINDVYLYDLGGHGLGPELTMWEFTHRAEAGWARNNRRQVEAALARGVRPIHGLVRWGPEYKEGLPGGKLHDKPPYREWARWHQQREDLFVRTDSGAVFRPEWGVISPPMPLDEKDWPPGVKNATYADWLVSRLAGLYEQTGLVGSFAADFYDCLPHFDCGTGDFHPRVVDAFSRWSRVAVPPGPIPERAAFIKKNCMHEWISFFCESYGRFWGNVARAVRQKTGRPGFVSMQGTHDAYYNRWIGRDVRLLEKHIVQEAQGRGLRVVELQGDDGRPLFGISLGYGYLLDFACQAPDLWVGAQMNCPDHEAFRASLNRTFRGQAAARDEFARQYIKGHWLSVAWAHMADRDGSVRRAAQVFHRQYWDAGKVPEDVQRAMLEVCPARPFGPAYYFSLQAAYALERQGRRFDLNRKSALVDKGVPVGWAVSDVTLPGLLRRPENRPTAFLTPCLGLVPPEERARLEALAPVFDLEEAVRRPEAVPSPLRFSPDVCGYGFFDREDRLVVLVWRPSGGYGADVAKLGNTEVAAAVSLSGIPDGKYAMEDLFDPKAVFPCTIAGRTGSFTFPLGRWEVRAFRTKAPVPRRNGTFR